MTTRSATRYDTQPSPPRRRDVTEAEFVEWCDEKTWAEWVDGKVFKIGPVNIEHCEFFGFFYAILRELAEDSEAGIVLGEPMQVRFAEHRRRRSPDITVVAESRRNIIKTDCIDGAPDLIVEIVSRESVARDWREKYLEYEKAGVREYWVVDPQTKRVEVYALGRDGAFKMIALRDGAVRSKVLKGFFLKPEWLWREKLPKVREILRELGVR